MVDRGLYDILVQEKVKLIFWTLIALVITVMHGKNAFTEKGMPSHEITIEDTTGTSNNENYEFASDIKKRLEEIKYLYDS